MKEGTRNYRVDIYVMTPGQYSGDELHEIATQTYTETDVYAESAEAAETLILQVIEDREYEDGHDCQIEEGKFKGADVLVVYDDGGEVVRAFTVMRVLREAVYREDELQNDDDIIDRIWV